MMNLNNNPTTQEFSTLIAACNDTAGHHILWVSKTGDVAITQLVDENPIGFEKNTPSMAMRYETFQQGNDYVGKNAAQDHGYVSRLLNTLLSEWKQYPKQGVRYIG
ncbi:hypothetical protein H0I68_03065 [Yersinia kristensenii]|uniref:hypothetical protein n=2 Tax=Yersinia kristensenii TaxID=28152 RepID=UPI0030DC0234|nr:hypothetical protein [Yersinia kristensenii]